MDDSFKAREEAAAAGDDDELGTYNPARLVRSMRIRSLHSRSSTCARWAGSSIADAEGAIESDLIRAKWEVPPVMMGEVGWRGEQGNRA
jgi:hypothetical protein